MDLIFSEQHLALNIEAAWLKCFNLLQLRSVWLYLALSGNHTRTDAPISKDTAGA